jgi:lipid A 3-O-deacylase
LDILPAVLSGKNNKQHSMTGINMRLFKSKLGSKTVNNRILSLTILIVLVMLFVSSQSQAGATRYESNAWKVAIASSLSLMYITNPLHADRMIFESGGGESVYIVRAGAQWDWEEDILEFLGFKLGAYLQADYAKWQSTKDAGQEGANNSIGFTPVFRFTRHTDLATIYLDTSIGFAWISATQINDNGFGSNFQFTDSLSVGALFGARRQWGVGYKFNHMSNNSIKLPNNGINFHLISLSYEY